ncbi:hypothetical protein AYO45_04175 [Gammaproteobacteria bacterium SCGC AG-212-F23]|nr:hypothetical protein AYO45_04175 [Gammaproteobacteria bacterium SCGC AG-212-F23]
MTRKLLSLGVFLFIFPALAMAGWQVAQPTASIPNEPFFQTGNQRDKTFVPPPAFHGSVFPNRYAKMGRPAGVYAISISGSLKENLERIMHRYRWRVAWKAPYDYNFDGRITGSSLPNVIEKLLQPFPLQAVMYMSNRTLEIRPRS